MADNATVKASSCGTHLDRIIPAASRTTPPEDVDANKDAIQGIPVSGRCRARQLQALLCPGIINKNAVTAFIEHPMKQNKIRTKQKREVR